MHPFLEACEAHKEPATRALELVKDYIPALARIPGGCDTIIRLAWRIHHGKTIEESAAREYVYRWHLVLDQWRNHAEARARSTPVTGAFPVPHEIGM